ncbi:zinc finger and SCAN domain-containing protein 29-like [Gopherus flavomarginatus]|uniref:zinc finger and SCAN domain-containing protein 29-like n=1 Tax=Gopherus flavomarginatus TaxID=286002 RepID=UPI0021CC14FF|nr:zinc finger and SCAN domain-containing protein 29-like [Gopherus flavomarginatus]
MPPRAKRAPAWSNGELMDLISVWGEEAVQSQLRSSHRNYDTYGQISRAMLERGHERDAVQCRVKVKELRSAYCKAREGNCRSGAAPTTCRFYKQLDAILGGDPTANPTTMMDTSERGEGVGEEKEGEETESEGTGVEGDTPESQEACSQELFSSQEDGSQSQQLVLDEGQAEERVPVSLTTRLPVSSIAQRLQNLRKKPRKSKDMLKAVMDHCQRVKNCRTGGKRKAGSAREMQRLRRKAQNS